MRKIVMILIAISIFVFGHKALIFIYPNAEIDYNVFIQYYYAKEKLNEFLFSLLFLIIFLEVKNKVFSSMSVFGFTLTFCSLLDKALFYNYNYLATDVVVVLIALILSVKVYKNG